MWQPTTLDSTKHSHPHTDLRAPVVSHPHLAAAGGTYYACLSAGLDSRESGPDSSLGCTNPPASSPHPPNLFSPPPARGHCLEAQPTYSGSSPSSCLAHSAVFCLTHSSHAFRAKPEESVFPPLALLAQVTIIRAAGALHTPHNTASFFSYKPH